MTDAPRTNPAIAAMVEQIARLKADNGSLALAAEQAQRETETLLQEKRQVLADWRKTIDDLVRETERANRAERELEDFRKKLPTWCDDAIALYQEYVERHGVTDLEEARAKALLEIVDALNLSTSTPGPGESKLVHLPECGCRSCRNYGG